MKAYSLDLRERIVNARRHGDSVAQVAQRFGVCTKTVRGYEQRARQGRLAPTPRRGKARRLSEADHAALVTLVQTRSDWTLDSLAHAWQDTGGVALPSSTLHDALRRLKITRKKRVVSLTSGLPQNGLLFA